jgi:putative FmdB family regulatory protein
MPLFEYFCEHCNYGFDKMVLRWDSDVTCPLCRGRVKKLMSTFSVGGSQTGVSGLPADLGPKMCRNC